MDYATEKVRENGNGVELPSTQRLIPFENKEHSPESYEDMQLDYSPLLFSSLERYLPPNMLNLPRDRKVHFLSNILTRYSPQGEHTRVCLLHFFIIYTDWIYRHRYTQISFISYRRFRET